MRPNTVKRALKAGGTSIGTMVYEFSSTGIGRLAAAAGAEFIIYDMEHTGWDLTTVRELMATTRAAETIPMVRIPATQYHFLARPLDLGAMGLMVPMVESAEQARLIVDSTKYPPVGKRGAAFGVAHDDYTGGDVGEKMRSANDEIMLIAQVETAAGLDQVEAIAAVDGIDVIWIGQFDLTSSLGIAGQFDHPHYHAAVKRIVAAADANGKAAGFMVLSVENGKEMLAKGFRCISYSGDLWIYQQALKQGVEALRAAAGA